MQKLALRSIKLLTLVSIISSCAVARPNTDVCIVNAPNNNRKCYNLKSDYNDDGSRKATAVPVYRDNKSIDDLNKAMVVDSPTGYEDGLAALKTYINQLRAHYKDCQAKGLE